MLKSLAEFWLKHPDIPGVEVSSFGNIRTLDGIASSEKRTHYRKGKYCTKYLGTGGYLSVSTSINGKRGLKQVHRLVAETFIPNPHNLPQVNHKDGNRMNNNASNLEWCDASYNCTYKEKFGEAQGKPVYAINLATLAVYSFPSRHEASRFLGIDNSSIGKVAREKLKQAGGYWFVEDDCNGIDVAKNKLYDILGDKIDNLRSGDDSKEVTEFIVGLQ